MLEKLLSSISIPIFIVTSTFSMPSDILAKEYFIRVGFPETVREEKAPEKTKGKQVEINDMQTDFVTAFKNLHDFSIYLSLRTPVEKMIYDYQYKQKRTLVKDYVDAYKQICNDRGIDPDMFYFGYYKLPTIKGTKEYQFSIVLKDITIGTYQGPDLPFGVMENWIHSMNFRHKTFDRFKTTRQKIKTSTYCVSPPIDKTPEQSIISYIVSEEIQGYDHMKFFKNCTKGIFGVKEGLFYTLYSDDMDEAVGFFSNYQNGIFFYSTKYKDIWDCKFKTSDLDLIKPKILRVLE